MSFINTIEDDSDQVELIVRQRFEAKPGCNIVGFDAYDQTGAVTELSTQLSSNSSRIDGIISSLSGTDANVIALNSNLLTAIANAASNTVTNASLVSDLRADVNSNASLVSSLQANTISLAADISTNTNRISVLESNTIELASDISTNATRISLLATDLASNASLLSNATARIAVVEQNTSNLSNLTNTVSEHTTDILNLEQSVNLLDSIEGALDGNSSAITALSAAGVSWGLTIFNAIDKAASKVRVSSVESVLENQFGDDLANLTSGNTSSDVSADINALKDVVNLENWGNLLGVDVVLSSPGNIGAPLTSNVIRFNDALFGTSNTSVCQALKSNISELQAYRSNTNTLLSNIQSELFTHDTLLALHSNELADNVVTITNLSTSLADNSSRISSLESSSAGGLFTNTITSQRANGQAAALYARDTNNPDRADNIEYNYVLNAPRPGTTTGGIDLFINSANRTDDGGASTATLRNANGNLRLGNPSYDTILEGGNIGVSGKQMYPMLRWEIDLTSQSTTNFYPIEFTHPFVTNLPDMHPIHFKVFGESLSGSDSYNENTLVGYAKGGGYTDHGPMYDVHIRRYTAGEHRFLGLYEGTTGAYQQIVIYMRGGYRYSAITDATSVVTHTSAYTVGSGSSSATFAIKNSSGTDVSGTSAAIWQLVNLAANARQAERFTSGDLNVSDRLGVGTNNPQSALHVTGAVNYNNQNPPGVEMGVHVSTYAAIEMTSTTNQTGWIDFKTTSSNSDYVDRIRGGLGNLQFFTNSGGERMVINSSGNVGINNNSPSYKLDVSGDSRVVGKCIVQTNNNANGIVCTGTSGGLAYYGYRDGDPGIKLTRTSVFTGEDNEYTLALLPAPGGTPRPNAIDLGSSSNYWRRTYTDKIYRNNEHTLSDDRIKTGETLLANATETLLKLKPQTYDKHTFEFDKFTQEEFANVSCENTVFSAHSNCWADQTELIENTIDDREEFPYIRRRLTEQAQKETGLIAQDIYYDCPELRHLISLPSDATPAEEKPTGSDDPQDDPDYDEAGWGTESASVSYTQIIPLLVKSNQELHERIVDHDAQIADLESANDAKQRRIDELEERVNALVARMELFTVHD